MTQRARTWLVMGLVGAAGVVTALVPEASLAQGCSMCATYLSAVGDQRAAGFRASILFLMAMPFVVVGSAGGWIFWMYWRSRPPSSALRMLRPEEDAS
jgi:hypothetical protein